MKITYGFLLAFLIVANLSFGYQLILKNGKTVQGTLITEDAEKITIKDKDGVVLNFKKSVVDVEKTAEANKPIEEPAKPAMEEPKTDSPETAGQKPKKPVRVYTANDLYRLRGEFPMDNTGAEIQSPSPEGSSQKMTGDQWQQLTQNLLAQFKQAEQNYQQSSAKCKELQGATVQTHIVVDQQNQPVNMVEATKQACQAAEEAKDQIDSARQEYQSAVEQAKQENIPPGYIAQE